MSSKNVNVIDPPVEDHSSAPVVSPRSPSASPEYAGPAATRTDGTPRRRVISFIGLAILAVIATVVILWFNKSKSGSSVSEDTATRAPAQAAPQDPNSVTIEDGQIQNIKLAAATAKDFTIEKIATGKIAYNDDVVTPVFSPYTGRIVRLLAKPGEAVKRGTLLAEVDTTDVVQAEQDLINQLATIAKAKTALDLAKRNEQRQHTLYSNKAASLAVWEQAQSDLKNAGSDLQAADAGLVAMRNRLKLFGKDDADIQAVERDRKIDRIARVISPLAGTITARKVGPGQFVKPDNPDPIFVIANLSSMWMLADIYETDVPLIKMAAGRSKGNGLSQRCLQSPHLIHQSGSRPGDPSRSYSGAGRQYRTEAEARYVRELQDHNRRACSAARGAAKCRRPRRRQSIGLGRG